MKTVIIFLSFFVFAASSYGDMLGINIELVHQSHEETLVSLSSPETSTNRQNVSVQEAATVLRHFPFQKDATFAMIHSKDVIPSRDLVALLQAMREGNIDLECIQVGRIPPAWTR